MWPFVFPVDYSSRSLYNGYAGFGVVTMFDNRVTAVLPAGVSILMEDGVERIWTQTGPGTYAPPPGVLDTLVGCDKNDSGLIA
jgi:hypothetical protein